MKAVILAGGYGTRISEETHLKPKPMVEIGGKPILWHILKIYSSHGINEFIICCGYKGYVIKEYFANYFLHNSDVTFDIENNSMEVHQRKIEPWKITLIDTGSESLTGGRLKRVENYIEGETFCFTYGDGVANIDIKELIRFHKKENCLATLTAVRQPGRFGEINYNRGKVLSFDEKPLTNGSWINGGFFVLEPQIFNMIGGDKSIWERDCLPKIAKAGQLRAYQHDGYWQPMDTMRDREELNRLWDTGDAPWKMW